MVQACEKCEGAGVVVSPFDGGTEPCPGCQPHLAGDPMVALSEEWERRPGIPSWARFIIAQQAEILRRLGVG